MCKNGGKTNTEIKNAITAADAKIQYDTYAKRLLAQKSILANILVKTVAEFKDMNPSEVANYIEGDLEIGIVPVELGLTNAERTNETGQRIVGFNTENAEINEGMIRFDIVFYVRMKDGLSQIIINVEAQKDEPQRYGILNRAVFYVSRLISSQKYHKRRIRYTDRTDNRAGGGYYVQSESGNKRSWNSGRPGRGNH